MDSLEENHYTQEANGKSIGKTFCESYFPVELLPFVMKCLQIFQKIIGKYENGSTTTYNEFLNMFVEKFKEDKNEQTTLV